ncbi:MAG: recombination regulator RecX [Armatimonadetes bacterium]|nr:recombination regulator RecX [Armatimonadota bacterium]
MRGHRRQKASQGKTEAIEKAKKAAFRLLRYRPRSERELFARLKAKGWDDSVAQEVVARLKRLGLIDDRQMAEAFVQSALSDTQPHSRFEVRYKLKSLGISDEIVDEVLSVWTDEVEYRMAERYIKRRLGGISQPSQQDIQRAFRAAMQRGFEVSAIRSAIRSFGDLREIE